MTKIPLPPKSREYKTTRHGFNPMSKEEATKVIDSYNHWAKLWNAHEFSSSEEEHPKWDQAYIIYDTANRNIFCFGLREYNSISRTERRGMIRIKGWKFFDMKQKGGRGMADHKQIVWAGWLKSWQQ